MRALNGAQRLRHHSTTACDQTRSEEVPEVVEFSCQNYFEATFAAHHMGILVLLKHRRPMYESKVLQHRSVLHRKSHVVLDIEAYTIKA